LPKEARRLQLLERAAGIVRDSGTDALTLATLAELSGVTKPVTYEHFGTREGLLMALYRHLDSRQIDATAKALAASDGTAAEAIRILSTAYIDCAVNAGAEFAQVAAALSANADMEAFRRAQRDLYVEHFRKALAPFVRLNRQSAHALSLGIVASADALAGEAASGHLTRAQAIDALTRIMSAAV